MSSWQCGWVSRAGFLHMLSYWSTGCFAARILELNKYPYQQKILYTFEIKYKMTQVKEIRYQQLPASNFSYRVWVSLPPPTLFTMGPEMRNLLLRYFDLHTMSMHRIGSSLSRLISALYLACLFKSSRIFFGLLHRESSFFQGPSSISCFKSCCDCCRTRDVLFRSFL